MRGSDDGEDPHTLHYHIQLLHDAGLIVADEIVPDHGGRRGSLGRVMNF